MSTRPSSPNFPSPNSQIPDLLGMPASRPAGLWGFWLQLTVPAPTAGLGPSRQRERLRRARLLSALQLVAFALIAILIPRGFLPVFDPGTVIGIAGFAVLVITSIFTNRSGHVTTAAWIFVGGLAAAIAGSQLFTPNGYISFQDLAGYDFLVIPIFISGILLSRSASLYMWLGCALFVVLDLGLAQHSPTLAAYLPPTPSPFLSIYPVAIYPLILTAIVAAIAALAAGSMARALEEADRTEELEQAYSLLAEQNRELEEAIAAIQQVHSRVANGDLGARAATASGSILLPLAFSLNLMLERLARTTSAQAALDSLQQQVLQLTQDAAALAQGRLDHAVPQHSMGPLRPIAQHLEQLRVGIVQVTQYTYSLASQLEATQQTAATQMQALEQQPQLVGEIVPQLQRTLDAEQTLTRTLRHYLTQFVRA